MTIVNLSTFKLATRFCGVAAVTGILLAASLSTANSQSRVCGERTKLTSHLNKQYAENPLGLGVGGSGKTVYEVYTSQKGTWTVLMTATNGVTCIMATGHSWRHEDQVAFMPKT